MTMRSTIRWILLGGVVLAAVACSEPKKTPGPDSSTGSDASVVAWSDGQSAIAISCSLPGGCQQRAQAMCPAGYTTLKSTNMPVAGGNAVYMTGPASATVRCK